MRTMVFISLPMRDKSEEEIIVNQQKLFGDYQAEHPDAILINEFNPVPKDQITLMEQLGREDVYMLGRSIALLSFADVVIFAKGWENYSGCRIEHKVATYYDIPKIYA